MATEQTNGAVWFLEKYAPDLLLMITHASSAKVLASLTEMTRWSVQDMAGKRYSELDV